MLFCIFWKLYPCRYWEVQVELGEAVQGWIYWTWKVRPFLLASVWWDAIFVTFHRRKVRTNGAIRRVLREAGFHKIPRNDCIRVFVMVETRTEILKGCIINIYGLWTQLEPSSVRMYCSFVSLTYSIISMPRRTVLQSCHMARRRSLTSNICYSLTP